MRIEVVPQFKFSDFQVVPNCPGGAECCTCSQGCGDARQSLRGSSSPGFQSFVRASLNLSLDFTPFDAEHIVQWVLAKVLGLKPDPGDGDVETVADAVIVDAAREKVMDKT